MQAEAVYGTSRKGPSRKSTCPSLPFLSLLLAGMWLAVVQAILNNEVTLEMESMPMDSKALDQPWTHFLHFCKREVNFYLV